MLLTMTPGKKCVPVCSTGALEVWHQPIWPSHSETVDPVEWWAGPACTNWVSETNFGMVRRVILLLWFTQTRGRQVKHIHILIHLNLKDNFIGILCLKLLIRIQCLRVDQPFQTHGFYSISVQRMFLIQIEKKMFFVAACFSWQTPAYISILYSTVYLLN